MSATTPPDVAPNAAGARRREWLARGVFEAVLILIGLLGAFALNEWQDARTRAFRLETLMVAVRTELEANLQALAPAATYNVETAEDIWNKGNAGVAFIPDGTYTRGIFQTPRLTSVAWTTAQNEAVLSDMPVEKVLLLASIYDMQQAYVSDVGALFNNMYAAILVRPDADAVLRVDGLGQPRLIGGVLRDHARRGARLVEQYRAVLAQL